MFLWVHLKAFCEYVGDQPKNKRRAVRKTYIRLRLLLKGCPCKNVTVYSTVQDCRPPISYWQLLPTKQTQRQSSCEKQFIVHKKAFYN